jgi:Helicase associated domain
MAEEIVQTVRLNGGRFLQEQDGAYWEVPRSIAVGKASQALREEPPVPNPPEKFEIYNEKIQAHRKKATLKVSNAVKEIKATKSPRIGSLVFPLPGPRVSWPGPGLECLVDGKTETKTSSRRTFEVASTYGEGVPKCKVTHEDSKFEDASSRSRSSEGTHASLPLRNALSGALGEHQEARQKVDSLLAGLPHAKHNIVTPQATAVARPLYSHDEQKNRGESIQLPVLNANQKERPSDTAPFTTEHLQTQHPAPRSKGRGLQAFSHKEEDSTHGQKGSWTEPISKVITRSSGVHFDHTRGHELSKRESPNSAVTKATTESLEQTRREQASSIDKSNGASQESHASREIPLQVGAGRMGGHEGVARKSDAVDTPASWERPPQGVVRSANRLVGVTQGSCSRPMPTFGEQPNHAQEASNDGQDTSEIEDNTTAGDGPVSHARNEPFVWNIYHKHPAKDFVWKVPGHPPVLPLTTKGKDEVLPWEIPPPRDVKSQLTPTRSSRRCPLPPSQIFRGKRADDRDWVEMYEQMVRFLLMNGECIDDPKDVKEEDRQLLKWARAQRKLYWDDKLDLMRQRLLEQIGFVWRPTTAHATSSRQRKLLMVAEDSVVVPNKRSRQDEIIENPTIDLSDTYLTI